MFDNPFMPESVKDKMCAKIDMRSAAFGVTLSDIEWRSIFEDFCFPLRHKNNLEAQQDILYFLEHEDGISGIPSTVKQALKVLNETTKRNKPAKITDYDTWAFVFQEQTFPSMLDAATRIAMIEYLETQKSFPFLVITLTNKHSALSIVE